MISSTQFVEMVKREPVETFQLILAGVFLFGGSVWGVVSVLT